MIRIYFKTHNSFSKTCDFNRNIYRGLREAFKNPGGYSSVNHQHYHLYYLEERLYIETLVYIEFKIKIECNKTKLNLYNNDIFFEESGTYHRPLLRSYRFSSQRISISA